MDSVKAKKMLKQKVSDKDFTVTLNAYFIVKWHDSRVVVTDNMNRSMLKHSHASNNPSNLLIWISSNLGSGLWPEDPFVPF